LAVVEYAQALMPSEYAKAGASLVQVLPALGMMGRCVQRIKDKLVRLWRKKARRGRGCEAGRK